MRKKFLLVLTLLILALGGGGKLFAENGNVAKVGNTEYATIDQALAATKTMTGDVTVEIYDKVTFNQPLIGDYTSINFVGKDTDAEMYLDVQGYTTATGKEVTFTDLKLSKSVGGHIANAGFMNVAFGIYDVVEVTYTKCTFLNGACASSGKVTFNGCTFYRSHDKYGLWAYGNVDVTVENSTFADYRGIKMYDEGKQGTVALTVKNTDFSAVNNKPAIVLTYGESVQLAGNTYSTTGVFELDIDGKPNGVAVTSDVAPTCINDNGACGVLVDGKIYTTVAQAAEVATSTSTVTLLHNSTETIEFPMGVTLEKNGFEANGVTVVVPVAQIGEVKYETFQAALNAIGSGDVVINLLKDVTMDITAWQTLAIGAENTTSITIDGENGDNDFTLTFNKLNSDWNHIATSNDNATKLILKNLKLADSGKNNGPWNRYDHNFACDVELTNVVSNKALAFKAGATLNNVTINETGDNYAIWIQPNGQDVDINDLTVVSAGRGIKIDNQYVGDAQLVNLSVTNAKFETVKKAAIVVKSPAGANIVAEKVDITKVAADSRNLVWVDEDGATDFGKVILTGGTVAQEGLEGFVAAITKGANVEGYYKTLQKALNDAVAGTGNVTVTILKDINLTGIDWNPVTVSAPGYPVVTVEGNNNTITGLNDMLFAATWAGNSGLIIKNLTIENSTIENDKNDAAGNVGVGAFVGYPQASAIITLENCHLKNSSVEGGHWTGGLIGMAGGYNGADGPVFMNLTIKGCSVTGSTITGKGSVGGVIGHGSCSAWTNVVIEETTVSGNAITSTGSSDNKAGAVMGTIGAAGQATTVNGVEKQGGALVAATVSGNTVKSNGTAITTIYGRQGTNTGVLELNGGSYDNYPIEEGVAYAKPIEGYKIKGNNGTYGIVALESKEYEVNESFTLAQAIAQCKTDGTDIVTYKISGAATLETGFSHGIVDFGGKDVTIIGKELSENSLTIVGGGVPDIKGVAFKNITIADEGTYLPTANEFMYQNFIDCTFENVKFEDGIRLSGNCNIKDCTVNANTANEYAIWLDAGQFEITGTNVEVGNDAYGMIKSDSAEKIVIKNNTFTYLGNVNKEALNTKGAVIIAEGNTFIDCAKGIVPADKQNYTEDGNQITDAIIDVNNEIINYVAQIGTTKYETLAAAVTAATEGQTIELLWSEGKAPIAMNASLYGKSVTITGTATVDWSKGFLFVGRGGAGNATLTFDGANLTSASDNASTGIHVSGREKGTNNKYDGTVVIKNSTIVLDYLINKGAMTLDNATLTVKNGFAIGGRPASETESGVDATATIALTNGSKVVVNNHNGMGLGYEAIGVMNIDATSTFETTQSFLVTAKGTMNIAGTAKVVGTLTNKGAINLTAENASLTAQAGLTVNSTVDGRDVIYASGVYTTKLGLKGAGTESEPYLIASVKELEAFRASVNEGETKYNAPGVYVALNAYIDLAGTTWERGIGDGINATFDGIFDGRDKTIKNLTMNPTPDSDGYVCGGLFGYIYGAATIKNLVIENATITATVNGEGQGHNVGVLVGFAYNKGGKANISNITVKGDVKVDAPNVYGVGSIVGYSYYDMGTIDNCKVLANEGSYIKGKRYVGGITGYSYDNAVITKCIVNNLALTGEIGVGGIAGLAKNGNNIAECTVTNVTVNGDKNVAYIVGELQGEGGSVIIADNNNAPQPWVGGSWGSGEPFVAMVGTKYYTSISKAIEVAQAGQTVTILAGTYPVPAVKAGITIEGQGDVLFEGTLKGTLENLTMKNIHIKGGNAQRWAYAKGDLVFENVTFEATSVYALHFDGIAEGTNLTYKNCTIIGWAAMGGSPASCTFDGCTIKGNGTYGLIRTYFDATIKDCTFDVADVNTTDVYQDGIHAVSGATVTVNNCTNVNGDMKDIVNVHTTSVVTVDGVVIKNVVKANDIYYRTLAEAFAANSNGTVTLLDNIDLAGAEWTPVNFNGVFDGQNYIISNLVVNGGSNSNQGFFAQTNNGEIKNVTFNNAKVTGRLNVGVVAGTPYTSKYTNVKVTGHVEVNGYAYVGGVGGKNAYANWTDITVDVDSTSYVKADSENYRTYVGGVVGFNGEGGHTFKNISSNIKVIGSTCDIGGIFGIAHYNNKFENITFTGSVEAPEGAEQVGGIAGVWHNEKGTSVTFTNCTSEGTVTIGEETTTGSIVGAAYNAENETAENSGSLIIDGVESWLKVAQIGEVKYTTLQAAVNAVKDGDTITLIANEVFTKNNRYNNGGWWDGLGYSGDKSFTIDLAGKTIKQDGNLNDYLIWIKNDGSKDNTINIINGTLDAGTTAYCALATASSNSNKITINTSNINFVGNNSSGAVLKIRGGAELNANAGTIITGKNNYVGIEVVGTNTVVNINEGVEIYQNGTSSYVGSLAGVSYGATLNVIGGKGTSAQGGFIAMTSGGTINVSGGEWIANTNGTPSNDNKGVLIAQSEKGAKSIVNVKGGTFRGGYNCYGAAVGDAQINIKGGNFNANPTTYVVDKYEVVEEANGTFTVKMASFEKFYTATGVETTTGGVFSLAFEPTSETEVSVKIGSKNPAENKNYDLIIPSSVEFDGKTFAVTSIPVEGFKGCKGFDKLVVPGTITSVSASAFHNCSRLKEIIIEEGVQKLGKESFYKISDLETLTLPSTLTRIETLCFNGTHNIKTIVCNAQTPPTAFKGSFTELIYKNALVYVAGEYEDYKAATGWQNFNNIIAVGATQTIVKTNYTLIATITDIWNKTCSVEIGTAPTNTKRAQLEIPEHVSFSGIEFDITSIPESGFQDCKYFEGTLTIPAYITSIDSIAFNGCSGITELVVEEGVTSLGTYGTFEGCRDIETIILPSTLETIPSRCFHNIQQKLNTIVCYAMTPPTLGSNFSDGAINDGLTLYVHNVDAYKKAARWKKIKSIRLIGAVAQNMTTSREYKSLQEAINEAAGATVKVLDNVVLEEAITVAAGAEVTLDLNGKVVSYESAVVGEDMITNNGKLTVESSVAGGKITYNNTDETGSNVTISTISTVPGSELIINGGIIENTSLANYSSRVLVPYAIDILTNGGLGDVAVTINGGEIVSTNYIAIRQFVNGNVCNNSLTVTGGTITGLKRAINVQDAQGNGQVKNCAILLVEAGDIIAGEGGYAICNFANSENVALTGGNFVGTVYSAIEGIISGGTFSEEPYSGYLADGFICEPNADGTYSVIEEPIYTQTIRLKAGWNWFSSYVETDLESLQAALGTSGVRIKDDNLYTDYYAEEEEWYGSLNSYSYNKMYMIKATNDIEISISGNLINTNDIVITLVPGWNWISYPNSESVDINIALQNLDSQEGDKIKSDSPYAYFYEGYGWYGSLNILEPGVGYMYYNSSNLTKTFTYSTSTSTSTRRSEAKANVTTEGNYWTPNAAQFANNMTMTAVLDVENINYEVAAFVNGECRGSARPIYVEALDAYMLFLTIHGEEVEEMTFKYYDIDTDTEYTLSDRINYSNNAILGSLKEPYMFTRGTTGIGEAELSQLNIYPNPTTTAAEINLNATFDKVEVFNALGVKVAEYSNVDSIDALETAGIYVIRATNNSVISHCRLVVK